MARLILTAILLSGMLSGASVKVMETTLVCTNASVIAEYVKAIKAGKYEAAAIYANEMILQPQCTSWPAGSIAAYHHDQQYLALASRYTYWRPLLTSGKEHIKLHDHGVIRVWPRAGSRGFYAPGMDFNFMYFFAGNCPVLGPPTKACPVPEGQR